MKQFLIVAMAGLPKGRVRDLLYRPVVLFEGPRHRRTRKPTVIKEEMLPGYGLLSTDRSLDVRDANIINQRLLRFKQSGRPHIICESEVLMMQGLASPPAPPRPSLYPPEPKVKMTQPVIKPNRDVGVGSKVAFTGAFTGRYGFVTSLTSDGFAEVDTTWSNMPIRVRTGLLTLYSG